MSLIGVLWELNEDEGPGNVLCTVLIEKNRLFEISRNLLIICLVGFCRLILESTNLFNMVLWKNKFKFQNNSHKKF